MRIDLTKLNIIFIILVPIVANHYYGSIGVFPIDTFAFFDSSNLINKGFVPVMVDVDDTQEKELLERYDIGGTPITVVTDSKGNAFGWRVGGVAKADFLEFLTDPNPPKGDDV